MIAGGWEICTFGYCTGPDIVYDEVLAPVGSEIADSAEFIYDYYAEDPWRLPRNFAIGAAIPIAAAVTVAAPEVVIPAAATLGIVGAGCAKPQAPQVERTQPETATQPAQQPAQVPADVFVFDFESPFESQCRSVADGYSWTPAGQTTAIKHDNIEIKKMSNPAFQAISALWIADKFKAAKMDIADILDWAVTKRMIGPMTLDQVCHRDSWWSWSNGVYETPEGYIWDVDYGYADEQGLILQGLYAAGVNTWHPRAVDYMGEYVNLASSIFTFTENTNDPKHADVNLYVEKVKASFAGMMVNPCSYNPVEFFLTGVVPLASIGETQMMSALDALGVAGNDTDMATILKAAWYIRAANSLRNDPARAEEAAGYYEKAKQQLVALLCNIPDPMMTSPLEIEIALSRIVDPERRELVAWVLAEFYQYAPPAPPVELTAQDCYGRTNAQGRHVFILNEDHTDCAPCPEGQRTRNGETCYTPPTGGGHGGGNGGGGQGGGTPTPPAEVVRNPFAD